MYQRSSRSEQKGVEEMFEGDVRNNAGSENDESAKRTLGENSSSSCDIGTQIKETTDQPENRHPSAKPKSKSKIERMKILENSMRRDFMLVILKEMDEVKKVMENKISKFMNNLEKELERKISDALEEDGIEEEEESDIEDATKDNDASKQEGEEILRQQNEGVQVDQNVLLSALNDKIRRNQRTVLDDHIKFAKFNYMLTKEADYSLWKDKLRSEVKQHDCLFLMDEKESMSERYPERVVERRRDAVRNLIITHLDEYHHRLVKKLQDPREIMRCLDQVCEPTSKMTVFSLKKQFGDLRFDPRQESALDFLAKFDDLVERIQKCDDLDQNQIKSNLLIAIELACPSIYLREMASKDGLTTSEIRQLMVEEEARQKEIKRREESKETALIGQSKLVNDVSKKLNGKSERKGSVTCYKCGQNGHTRDMCQNDKWKCYSCGRFTDSHLAQNCPIKNQKPNNMSQCGQNRGGYRKSNQQNTTGTRSGRFQRGGRGISVARKLKRIPYRQMQRISKLREKTGRADLVFYVDEETANENEDKRMCWVDDTELAEPMESEDLVNYATVKDEEAGTAYSGFDGEYKTKNYLNFVADTGATEHLVNSKSCFIVMRKLEVPRRISCANKNSEADLVITHAGDIVIKTEQGKLACLTNVLYSPSLSENLFSLRKMIAKGMEAKFTDRNITLRDEKSGEVMKIGTYDGRFWWLGFPLPLADANEQEKSNILKQITCFKHTANYSQSTSLTKVSDLEKGGSSGEVSEANKSASDNCENVGDRFEMKTEDLEEIAKGRTKCLKDCEGLLWHYRLNHASKGYLEMATKVIPEMKGAKFPNETLECRECKLAKAKRQPCSQRRHRATKPLMCVNSDLLGPIKPCSYRTGAKYIVTFIDDYSRFTWAFPIADKTQVHIALSNFLDEARRVKGNHANITKIRTDGGTEYKTHTMRSILTRENIAMEVSEPYTPQHNGCSERGNLEIEEKVRVNLLSAKMPNYLWAHALNYSVHVHNRTPNSSINFKTPYELFYEHKPQVKYIRRFGCEAYVLDMSAKFKSKFAPRAKLGFLFECNETGYTIFDAKDKTLTRSKHVDFVESRVYGDYLGPDSYLPINEDLTIGETDLKVVEADRENSETNTHNSAVNNNISEDTVDVDMNSHTKSSHPDSNTSAERNRRVDDLGEYLGEDDEFEYYLDEEYTENLSTDEGYRVSFANIADSEPEPVTYLEAIHSESREKWIEAINEEYDSLEKCDTWELIPKDNLPPGSKIIKSRWVNKRKLESNGNVRYRSRLVAKGFADNNEYDRSEVYAPVARLGDVRFILAVANKLNLELLQLDVKTAFLHGTLEKPVYLEIPEGLEERIGHLYKSNNLREEYVCLLKRAIYGLRVSPKRWFVRFNEAMNRMRFCTYPFQPCLFVWRCKDKFAVLLLYVDDILVTTNCEEKLKEIKENLSKEFKITDLGEPKKFLGMEIVRDRKNRKLFLHQGQFIGSLLRRFNMTEVKGVSTPMVTREAEKKTPKGGGRQMLKTSARLCEGEIPYRQAIGSLLYLSNSSRPDITYAVNVLSRKQSSFTLEDWVSVKRIIRYLHSTRDLGLVYRGDGDGIECYPDASLGLNDEGGRSTSGFALFMFGDLISWRSKKQNHVALSSAESEFIAMSLACRELAYVSEMSRRILRLVIVPVIFEDNKAAIELAKTEETQTLKHIVNLCYHYIRFEVRTNNVRLEWISTRDQVGDFFTKALPKPKFCEFRDRFMSSG